MGPSFPPLLVRDAGHGFDQFGLSATWLGWVHRLSWPLYRYYFRVESHGAQHLPREGALVMVANHSGALPFDGLMLCVDVARRTGRVLRPIADHFVGTLPYIGLAMQRMGAVGGSMGNARTLLSAGESVLIFPEGVAGISKRGPRYKLTHWRPGHAELALRNRVPIVPVAVVGAEEQLPIAHNSRRLGRLFGLPHLPIPWLPLPLPVKYHIYYGKPLYLPAQGDPDDPHTVRYFAEQSQQSVEALIAKGLRERRGVFT